jgi:hypothetical protein
MNFRKLSALLLMAFSLSACNKDPQPASQISKEAPKKYTNAVSLQGAVSDNKGLIKSGKIEAKSESGELLAETVLENSARFQLTIPAGAELPVILSFTPSADSPGVEKMLSVAVHPGISKYDINPLTTAIAKQAKALGGYTVRNMTRAAEESVHVMDANKTSTGFRGDPTTQYGGWH